MRELKAADGSVLCCVWERDRSWVGGRERGYDQMKVSGSDVLNLLSEGIEYS